MHTHLEIVLPQDDNIEKAVEEVMHPFNECLEEDERSSGSFWDWYEIGGRWSGSKLKDQLGREKIKEFRQELINRKITVSSIQSGKPRILPESQIPEVDRLWQEWFPEGGDKCLLFDHSGKINDMDICKISEIKKDVSCSRFIVALLSTYSGKFTAEYMLNDEIWNGVNHEKTSWNGSLFHAFDLAKKYTKSWPENKIPNENWLCVTVDYHS